MDTKKLRQKLLDLAIRGKLVPQDPNDEPASELLSRIHAEKLAMVGRGELKPKDVKGDTVIFTGSDGLPYEKLADGKGEAKCIDDEIPFEIPEGWAWARLNVISSILNGDRGKNYPAKSKLHDEGIPFVSAANLNDGLVDLSQMRYLDDMQFSLLHAGKLTSGDRLFCIRGSLGKHGVFKFDKGAIASSLAIVRLNFKSDIYGVYLDQLFDAPITEWNIGRFDNGTAQPNLSAKDFASFVYPIPPLAEQCRIVDALDKYLALVDGIERNWADLDDLIAQLKSKVLDLAVRGELTERDPGDEPASELLARIREEKLAMVGRGELKPKDVKGDTVIFAGSDGLRYEKLADGKGEAKCIEGEIPFEIPEGWAWARFSNIVRKIGSKDNQVKTKGLPKEGDYPVISQSATSSIDGYYSGTIQPITSVPVLLFGDHTRTVKYVNQPFVIGADGTKCHNAIGVDPVFLFHAMQVAAERIEKRGYGRHYALLEKYLLAIPPRTEQRRINSAVETIFAATNL